MDLKTLSKQIKAGLYTSPEAFVKVRSFDRFTWFSPVHGRVAVNLMGGLDSCRVPCTGECGSHFLFPLLVSPSLLNYVLSYLSLGRIWTSWC